MNNLFAKGNKIFPNPSKQNEKFQNILLQFKQKTLQITEATEESHDYRTIIQLKNENFFH